MVEFEPVLSFKGLQAKNIRGAENDNTRNE
jgi:hypothetical protein